MDDGHTYRLNPECWATKNTQAAYTEVSSVTTNACSSDYLYMAVLRMGLQA